MIPSPCKALSFPWWVEAILLAAFAVMAVVEYRNDQLFWSVVFGAAVPLFGIGLVGRISRVGGGEPHDRA